MESKIAATERLRREGRWEDATWWRDQDRKRLRDEGMTRREANEKSWELMIQRFKPLTDEQIDWHEANEYRAMAQFPIECAHVDHGSEPPMSDIWWGWCYLQAWYSRRQKGDIEGSNFIVDHMEAERRVPLMAEGPTRFLEHVVTKFEAAIQRLEQDDSVDKHYAPELQANIDHIQKIRGAVQQWTEARELATPSEASDACASS